MADFHSRVCQENALLTAQLDARTEELRRANAHKMGEFYVFVCLRILIAYYLCCTWDVDGGSFYHFIL